MRRLLIFLTALLLPLFAFEMNADEEKAIMKIPLELGPGIMLGRTQIQEPLECYFYRTTNAIITNICVNIGDVALTVTNCSTGNVWYDSFDSTLEPQTMLPISGEPGVYEITYITESGNIYEGTFIID